MSRQQNIGVKQARTQALTLRSYLAGGAHSKGPGHKVREKERGEID